MTRKHSRKRSSLIIVLVMLFLFSAISVAAAVKIPLIEWGVNNNQEDVKLLQEALNTYKGYDLSVDGIFGPETDRAVKDFQTSNALEADGIVGAETWGKLTSQVNIYTIKAAAGSGGTISPASSQQVVQGKSLTFTITPSSGYAIQNVKIDGKSAGAINSYTFSNIAANHSISVTFAAITPVNSTAIKPAGNSSTGFWQARRTWLQPVKGRQTADPTGGARYFGASRANGRAHAAIDFIVPNGTPVYAMTDGKVIRTSLFFQNTSAVEVKNTDGTVARYCEIAPAVSVNTIVHRGDLIGRVITNYAGTSMLHLEMYQGTASGSLSQGSNSGSYWYVKARNYQRRADLVDPTGAKDLPLK
jgi:peptidoglycan hydrolase-like protein with peptidoglycan-binding domain